MVRRLLSPLGSFLAVLLLFVATPAHADDDVVAPNTLIDAGRPLLASALQAAQTLQTPIEAATAKKAAGKKKMFIGIGGMGGGFLIATLACSSGSLGGCRSVGTLGALASAGGAGVLIWGFIEWSDANNELNRLAVQRPAGTTALIPLNQEWAVKLAAGRQSSASLALSW